MRAAAAGQATLIFCIASAVPKGLSLLFVMSPASLQAGMGRVASRHAGYSCQSRQSAAAASLHC